MNLSRNIKRVMIVGTMIVAMSIGGNSWAAKSVSASPIAKLSAAVPAAAAGTVSTSKRDDLLGALNQSSDEDFYYALYEGRSLADIAEGSGADVSQVVQLQSEQLIAQLGERLTSGSITREQYNDYIAEVPDIIRTSVYQL